MLKWRMTMIYARAQNYRRTRWQPNKYRRPPCSPESTQIDLSDAIGLSGTTNRWMTMDERWMSLMYAAPSVLALFFKSWFLSWRLSIIGARETYKVLTYTFIFSQSSSFWQLFVLAACTRIIDDLRMLSSSRCKKSAFRGANDFLRRRSSDLWQPFDRWADVTSLRLLRYV